MNTQLAIKDDPISIVALINYICYFGLNFLLIIFILIQWYLVVREKHLKNKDEMDFSQETSSHTGRFSENVGISTGIENEDNKKDMLIPPQHDPKDFGLGS